MKPDDHSIWILEYGYLDRYPASNLFAAEPFEGFRRLPFCFGLIRSASRCVLVDTGFWNEARHSSLATRYGNAYWRRPSEIVLRAEIDPAEVDTIILTHGDFDHAGCVGDFPRAHVYIQLREMSSCAAAVTLPSSFGFLARAAQDDLPQTLSARAERGGVTFLDGEASLADTIRLLPAFDTHTPGSQYVVLDNGADGRWIFPGDLIYVYDNVEGLRRNGVLAPIGMSTGSPSVWLTTVADLLGLVDNDTRRLLPFHDTLVWARYPSRQYDDGLHIAEISLAGGHPSVLASSALDR